MHNVTLTITDVNCIYIISSETFGFSHYKG